MSNVVAVNTPQQAVDTRYTQDVIPILDTSKFEHMQRVAAVMARMSTIPDSLKGTTDDKKKFVPFDDDVVLANCFRIVNQAIRWGMDPFAVVDCASIVHGRLMWEGKLVAAVIKSKLGVDLDYEFTNEDKPLNEKALGVIVSGVLPGSTRARTIEGDVAGWHRGDKSPWANPKAWKRQLRYMGAREWARAHAPAVMLGVYTDDEFDGMMQRDVPAGQRSLRMKDVTPPKQPPLDIPDIPDAFDVTRQVSQDVDEPLADPDGFLVKLAEDIKLCDSADELAEIADSNADLISRLPNAARQKAAKMLQDAAE